jgi:zinc transport system substrate-binding protein
MRRWSAWRVALLATVLISSSASAAKGPAGKIRAFVSILPQAYFVERIGGLYCEVDVLVGPGQSPATYEPTPRQMAKLGRSQVYFRIGVPFERGLIPKISSIFKDLKIVDTRNGLKLRYFRQSEGSQVPDPHIWLDPKLVKIQAATMCKALSDIDPAHAAVFEKNLQAFQGDLDRIDARIATMLVPLKGSTVYVFHPAFGYFCDSYGLTQVAVEIEGKEPGPRQVTELIEKARADGVKVIFVQPQFAEESAEAIAREIGAAVVPINGVPRDYLKGLEDMATVIKEALLHQ